MESSIIKAEIKKGNIIVVPSPVGAKVLREVYGVPDDRIGVLVSVWMAQGGRLDDRGMYLSMTPRQYNYYKRREDGILATEKKKHPG